VVEPIWVKCEGSGLPPNYDWRGFGTCQMCGCGPGLVSATPEGIGVCDEHYRKDILAMIARGDFDAESSEV